MMVKDTAKGQMELRAVGANPTTQITFDRC